MKKRLLSALLTFCMVLTMLPVSAFAAGTGTQAEPITNTENNVTVNKYVSGNGTTGDPYKLTLEAFASNKITSTTTTTPLDIVLVLDVSGSMGDPLTEDTSKYVEIYSDTLDENETYYIYDSSWLGSDYKAVSYREAYTTQDWVWDGFLDGHYETVNHPAGWYREYGDDLIVPKTGEGDNNPDHDQFYEYVSTDGVTKLEALQSAVNSFISSLNEKNAELSEDSKHRISIVKFADDSYYKGEYDTIGNNRFDAGVDYYNYTQVVQDFTSDAGSLTSAVNSLKDGGATAADYGMELANHVLNGDGELTGARNTAKKAVIFFTDGEPNHDNGFDGSVANKAIANAKTLKDSNTKIYTIGIFNSADPQDMANRFNRYMNAVSSNYPGATGYDAKQMGTRGEGNYYFTATDSEGLNDVFEGIADTVTNETLDVYPDAEAVLTDTLSEFFNFPEGLTGQIAPNDGNGVTVQYVPATDIDENGVISWGTLTTTMPDGTNIEVNVSGGTIKIKGFDYRANAVTEQADGSITGGKLVVTFPIELDEEKRPAEGGDLFTNNTTTDQAGLEYKLTADSKTNDGATKLDESPTVEVAAVTYTLTYDANGGAGGPGSAPNLSTQEDYPLNMDNKPTHSDDGKQKVVFVGWSTTKHSDIYAKNDTLPDDIVTTVDIPDTLTVYAVWGYDTNNKNGPDVSETKYAVTYDTNGGTPEIADNNVYLEGEVVTVKSGADLTKEGYEFINWTVTSPEIGVEISTGQDGTQTITMPAANVILTAQWKADSYNVIYNVTLPEGVDTSGFPKTPNAVSHEYGTTVTVNNTYGNQPVTVDNIIYTFSGWTATCDDVTVDNNGQFTMPAHAVTFTGSWVQSGTVTYDVTIQYQDENGIKLKDDVTIEGQTVGTSYASIVTEDYKTDINYNNQDYTYDDEANASALNGSVSAGSNTITLVYTLDNWKDGDKDDPTGEDSTTGGDGIPDKSQALVNFVSADKDQGTVTGNTTQVFTLKDPDGENIYPNDRLVTIDPEEDYTFDHWTKNDESGTVDLDKGILVTGGQTVTLKAHFAKDTHVTSFTKRPVTEEPTGVTWYGGTKPDYTLASGTSAAGYTVTAEGGATEVTILYSVYVRTNGAMTVTVSDSGAQYVGYVSSIGTTVGNLTVNDDRSTVSTELLGGDSLIVTFYFTKTVPVADGTTVTNTATVNNTPTDQTEVTIEKADAGNVIFAVFDISDTGASWDNGYDFDRRTVPLYEKTADKQESVPTVIPPEDYYALAYWTSGNVTLGSNAAISYDEMQSIVTFDDNGEAEIVFTPVFEPKKINVIFDISQADCAWLYDSPYDTQEFQVTVESRAETIPEVVPTVEGMEFVAWQLVDSTMNGTLGGTQLTYDKVKDYATSFDENGEATIRFVPIFQPAEAENILVIFDIGLPDSGAQWNPASSLARQYVYLSQAYPTGDVPDVIAPDGKTLIRWESSIGTLGDNVKEIAFDSYKDMRLPIENDVPTITYYAVFEDIETPPIPELPIFLTDQITIDCLNGEESHSDLTCDLADGTYSVEGESGGVTLGLAGDDESGWTYTIALDDQSYADYYDSTCSLPSGTHERCGDADTLIVLEWDADAEKWIIPESIVVHIICETADPDPTYSITGFTKDLVTEATETWMTGYDFPENGVVTIPNGGTVTLLYKLTVTGETGAEYAIEDNGAVAVNGSTLTGTIPNSGEAVVYVSKTFDASDITTDGKLINTASVTAGDNTDVQPGKDEATEEVDAEEEGGEPPVEPAGPFTLTYDANGGNRRNVPVDNRAYYQGDTAYLENNTDELDGDLGYHGDDVVFVGWSRNDQYSMDNPATREPNTITSVTFVNSNITVYAVWAEDDNSNGIPDYDEEEPEQPEDPDDEEENTPDPTYAVFYHPGYGKDQQKLDRRYEEGDEVEVLDNEWFEREGYTFIGWSTQANADIVIYLPGDTFDMPDHDVHLYAQWLRDQIGPEDTGVANWLNTTDHIAYLTGYPGGAFGPNNSMTRAEVAQMFYALLNNKNVTITATFPDVPADAWYATAVNTLASLGMVSGDADGNFRPNDPITRAEFCVIALAFAYEPESYSCSFTDVSVNDWFYTYVAQAASYGWIGGYADGSFGPNDLITRAQVTTIVNNMLGREADRSYVNTHTDTLVQFYDLTRIHWAYYDIMEAVNEHEYTRTYGTEDWVE